MAARPRGVLATLAASAAAAGAVGLGGAARAQAAGTTPTRAGIFSISPAAHELRAEPGRVLSPTIVGNSSPVTLRVSVTPVLVRQSRSGSFHGGNSAPDRLAARRVLAVSTRTLSLPGHSERAVLERWRSDAGHRHAWAGVVFRALPAGEDVRGAGVHDVEQLLGLDLLELRGAAPARGRITGQSVADSGPHRVALTLALRNVGGSFGTPRALRIEIRAAGGRIVARLAPVTGIVLPGVTRDFVGGLARRLPAGRYTAVSSARLPGRIVSRPLRFQIAPNGLLLAPSLVAGTVTAGGRVGGRATVRVSLRNQGTRPGRPSGAVAIYLPGADAPVARVPLTGPPVAPGHRAAERVAIGRLHRGEYRAVVTYRAPFLATNPASVQFVPRPRVKVWSSAWSWLRGHGMLIALAGALVAAAGFGVAWRRGRRPRLPAAGIRLRPLP